MRSGAPRFPGVVGYDETVLPELERALLAGHDWSCWASAGRARPG